MRLLSSVALALNNMLRYLSHHISAFLTHETHVCELTALLHRMLLAIPLNMVGSDLLDAKNALCHVLVLSAKKLHHSGLLMVLRLALGC